jgi:hypothetical protein
MGFGPVIVENISIAATWNSLFIFGPSYAWIDNYDYKTRQGLSHRYRAKRLHYTAFNHQIYDQRLVGIVINWQKKTENSCSTSLLVNRWSHVANLMAAPGPLLPLCEITQSIRMVRHHQSSRKYIHLYRSRPMQRGYALDFVCLYVYVILFNEVYLGRGKILISMNMRVGWAPFFCCWQPLCVFSIIIQTILSSSSTKQLDKHKGRRWWWLVGWFVGWCLFSSVLVHKKYFIILLLRGFKFIFYLMRWYFRNNNNNNAILSLYVCLSCK